MDRLGGMGRYEDQVSRLERSREESFRGFRVGLSGALG